MVKLFQQQFNFESVFRVASVIAETLALTLLIHLTTSFLDIGHILHLTRYPWITTTRGFWVKYPNPQAPHVLTVDTLSRSIDPETGVLRTERLLGCRQGVPVRR
jgi:hypothetical protein